MNTADGLKQIADTMERRYKVYSLPRWPGIMIPLFSAEIDRRNISVTAYKQLDGALLLMIKPII